MLANLCAIVIEGYEWWNIFRYIALAVMVLCALFVIIVVLMQQGQSRGLGALGGTTDTFYGKNKGKSIESKLKKLTTVCFIVMGVLSLVFFIVATVLANAG